MQVKTLKAHENGYGVREGTPYLKAHGSVYEVGDDAAAQVLIDAGLVEKVNGNSKNRGAAGVGTDAVAASKSDST